MNAISYKISSLNQNQYSQRRETNTVSSRRANKLKLQTEILDLKMNHKKRYSVHFQIQQTPFELKKKENLKF